MKRVAVVGASGFVGSTLVERLIGREGVEVVPLIHSSGNAWRLARRGLAFRSVNLLERRQIGEALVGCTHVVNCSRGTDEVMLKGLRNLVDASRKCGLEGFVHLSSVLVYGDPPPPESVTEDAPTRPTAGTYGFLKREQDEIVRSAGAAGLPSIILCPPNISGPYSTYLVQILSAIQTGQIALVEDGATPCNLVDVANLAYAIELALDHASREAPRLFVSDDEAVTWKTVLDHLLRLIEPHPAQPSIDREDLVKLSVPRAAPQWSLGRSLKHLVSTEVRAALRRDPLWAGLESGLRRRVAVFGGSVENRLRIGIDGPVRVEKVSLEHGIDVRLTAQQLRGSGIARSTGSARAWRRSGAGTECIPAWGRQMSGRCCATCTSVEARWK
jgi:2-alkyl-3-oxoalkanoate reductase